MARTQIAVQEAAATGEALTHTDIDQANGMYFDTDDAPLEEIILLAYNAEAGELDVTVKAGDNPPALAAGQGDVVVPVAATAYAVIGPLASNRYLQSDGTVEVDFEATMTGEITALQAKRTV